MFTHIKTTRKNKEIVSFLSRKLNLGTENHIARIAFAYSISKDRKFDLSEIGDSQGKEYSKSVLFGNNLLAIFFDNKLLNAPVSTSVANVSPLISTSKS